jgi:uncharacterized repeat protein (TIGR01451 family)
VTKVASPNPVLPGQELTYTLTIHNGGPSLALNVSLVDNLPADVTLVSVNFPGETCSFSNSQVQCAVDHLVAGDTKQAVIVVKPTRVGSITNSAQVASGAFDPNPNNNVASVTTEVQGPVVFLRARGSGSNRVLYLDRIQGTSETTKYADSPALRVSLQNPWAEIGTWSAAPALFSGTIDEVGNLHVFLGLKNSDDQGTQFDLRAEVWKNGVELLAAGETPCVDGIVREPARARETTVALDVFTPLIFDGTTDVLSLRALTRIGTGCSGSNHGSTLGLRLYYDGLSRPSRIGLPASAAQQAD